MKKIIEIRDLSFNYPGKSKLLSEFNLSFENNTINVIIANKGEGKTTLLHLIAGLLFPQKGEINVLKYKPEKRKVAMLQDIFFLHEDLLNTHLDIEKFEKIYAPFYPNYSSSRFYSNLNEFSIDHKIDKISNFSARQRKKLMIAFGLATKARVVLMDEPTEGLDEPSKKQLCKMLSASKSRKGCIVITNQQPADLENMIDRVVILKNQAIVFNQPTNSILKKILFKTSQEKEIGENTIYSDKTKVGYCQMSKNMNEEEGTLNLEVLFNAIQDDSEKINIHFL